jgi:[acyl-carrier-protein] S-malonyltransferase
VRQLILPVRWVETIQYMIEKGVTTFYECGPGQVLAGLNKRISRDITTENLIHVISK